MIAYHLPSSRRLPHLAFLASVCSLAMLAQAAVAQQERATAAQAYGAARGAVTAQPDGLLVCEGEEFQVRSPGWQARPFGENYYAATFANAFLSRKAFLGAPEQCERSEATMQVNVPAAGRYLVLVRYEAAYRFETQFRVVVEQSGRPVLNRLYGARDNLKIWAFREGLKTEVAWSWGAVENTVWEGHDAAVDLQPGPATIVLAAENQPEPAARRNIDLVMLTTDVEQVQMRIAQENYLPLDGLLTQSGDVFLRVSNTGGRPLTFRSGNATGGGNWQEHSPYWVHIRNWPKVEIPVAPGATSEWVEVGGTMDALGDGQWFWTGDGSYRAEFGVVDAAGNIVPLASFDGQGDLALAADCDTRYLRRLRRLDQVVFDFLDDLKRENPAPHGRTPTLTPIYASTFAPLDQGPHAAAVAEFKQMFAIADADPAAAGGRGHIDVRGVATEQLEAYCRALGANAQNVLVVSLGDEIGLPTPGGDANAAFRDWLPAQGLQPGDVLPGATAWTQIEYRPEAALKSTQPGVYYWSTRYLYHFGIQAIKERTDILRRHLPRAQIGANFSPHYPTEHMFLGETFKWVSVFRDGGMTLPWSEDYIWQVAVCTPQVNNLNLDLFRAGLRHRPDGEIMYYVMPHAPNNTPRTWRRLFYGALGHGMTMVNLFEFDSVHQAYTENHVDDPAMYRMVLGSFRELGLFEDIVQSGAVRPATTGLWFSETGDIWGDSHGSFAAAKRCLYIMLRNSQMPLDVVVEQDALDGTLDRYKTLVLADAHVSRRASEQIAAWVQRGGTLVGTAGAGTFDEYNRPNETLRALFGVDQTELAEPAGAQIVYEKQDLPFVEPIAEVGGGDGANGRMPAFCVRSRVALRDAQPLRYFLDDRSPAETRRTSGAGQAVYLAYLPGLTYFQPAIPRRPVDRGATDDAMIHFLPTGFAELARPPELRPDDDRPVACSEASVETTVIESPHGMAIPLINWTMAPIKGLRVTLNIPTPTTSITLAGGGPVEVTQQDGRTVLIFDLDAADALILR